MVVFVGATSAEHNFTAGNSSQLQSVSFHKNALVAKQHLSVIRHKRVKGSTIEQKHLLRHVYFL